MTETQGIEIGAFVGASPPTQGSVTAFETLIGRHLGSVMWYQGWDATAQPAFPTTALEAVRTHDGFDTHIVLHLTLEPWVGLEEIINGTYDSYLSTYAADVKAWGDPVRLRFAHEMIQDDVLPAGCPGEGCSEWYPWQDQPEDYISAFRHVHDLFSAAGATNVAFIWCPNNYPFNVNVVKRYYPGPEYVDWLCMDGYNWTDQDGQQGWPDWQWFDDTFYSLYYTFVDNTAIFGEKPIMIGEFASCEASAHEEEAGKTKPAWITNVFARMQDPAYSELRAFYWFQIDKECDWRVDSTPASLAAFRSAIADPYFTSHYSLPVQLYLPVVIRK